MKIIAHIRTDFPDKFGIPRQSGLVEELQGTVVFEPEYRTPAALRGLEEFSHIWLLWKFSQSQKEHWSATVKPPRLGGRRMGVFEGYTGETKMHQLKVEFPAHLLERYPEEKRAAVTGVLAQDPRPVYVQDPERIYGVTFGGLDVKFMVNGESLRVCDVVSTKGVKGRKTGFGTAEQYAQKL